MAESIDYRKKKKNNVSGIPFYGAVKSKNEVYFQMASLYQEAAKGKSDLSGKWMERIIKSRTSKKANS